LAFFSLSERAARRFEEIENRGFYTDLKRYLEKHRAGGTITTPAMPQIFALDRQLAAILEEGMENRWRRHRELQRTTGKWALPRGFQYASAEEAHSPTVSCLKPPSNIEAPALVKRLAKHGFTVGGGYGAWKEDTLRIGHMGEVQMDDLTQLLGAIDEFL
jgi:aspartate aminotransferase-like enzyme